jgi:hypothetical protein
VFLPDFSDISQRFSSHALLTGLAPLLVTGSCFSTPATLEHDRSVAIDIPEHPVEEFAERQRIADNLLNPRGMLLDGRYLLVAQAGEGLDNDTGTGSVVRLKDTNGDQIMDERQDLLGNLPSKNILHIVRRDEVFGPADIARGGDSILVSVAFFGGPSRIYEVEGDNVAHWNTVEGNINAMTYDEKRNRWFAVSSSSEQVLGIYPDRPAEEILLIPDLPEGQDPVPGYVRYEPRTGELLVSLFSGSPLGEEHGDGTEIVPRAGGIIRVDPEDGSFEWVVAGLTAPTDIAVDDRGRIYVLEFCSDFLEPVSTRDEMWERTGHGGFKRFSGRLLRIDPGDGAVAVIADSLDGPTNLHASGGSMFVSQGMGSPGRMIPGPDGILPLTGFIERLTLDE